ncbi:MAG: vitamin B12-dependent ribonucleotide reductase [Chitinivibrionales bacterium]|nr:vitamin B12-dependent ribonucleotide reductase [Chitinivibrionales bacterium]MBD3396732.1 vitamin B12-dependent ribonucleotide reductase [Chitinivibrionales bacterium]
MAPQITPQNTAKTVKSAVFRQNEEASGPREEGLKERLTRKKAKLSRNARTVLDKRYLKRNDNGDVIETPEDMFFRVAENIAGGEKMLSPDANPDVWTEKFYNTMVELDFLPNSPTLMNAGRELQQLAACFVLPVGDSMEEIFTSVMHTALIHKSGGGTGFSFSHIRPKNDRVKSTKGISSGPLSFMRVFDIATETVKQGGTRRGANMGILECTHPEVMDFIEMKEKDGVMSNFNISVGITNEFMDALKRDEEYPLRNPRTGDVVGRMSASKVFKRVVELAWKNGEPGIVFLDKVNASNPTPHIGRIESTNPCGEQPLLPYESCNLGSINLAHMTKTVNKEKKVDYGKLAETVRTAVRFLDDVIEVNDYPLPEIAQMTKSNRKVGLGVMGFADMLVEFGIAYNSHAAASLAEELMLFVEKEAKKVSAFLASERGVFPNFKGSVYDKEDGLPLRNATVTTVAPTGTISMIAGCSSGIEPLFAIAYEKNVLDGQRLLEVHPAFEKIARDEGFYSEELMKIVAETGSLSKVFGIPKRIRDVFVTSHDIEPRWHIQIQAAFQKYTDNAVSKTVNFRNNATVNDVEEVYRLAYDLNCKGVTVYRDGSRQNQVITAGSAGAATAGLPVTLESGRIAPRPRPNVTFGRTYKTKTGCGNLYVNINSDEYGFCEVFTQMGKSGGCAASNAEAVARLISISLRAGVDPKAVVEQLRGIRCPVPTWNEGEMILSCADAIARVLEKAITEFEGLRMPKAVPDAEIVDATSTTMTASSTGPVTSANTGYCPQCPECGGMMEHEGGCAVCRSCGYSKCG